MGIVRAFGIDGDPPKKPRVYDEMIQCKIGGCAFRIYSESLLRHCRYKHHHAKVLLSDKQELRNLLKSSQWFVLDEYNGTDIKFSTIVMIVYNGMLWCLPVNSKGILTTLFSVTEDEVYKFATYNHIRIITKLSKDMDSESLDIICKRIDDNLFRQLDDIIRSNK